jgi:hypothetical protein
MMAYLGVNGFVHFSESKVDRLLGRPPATQKTAWTFELVKQL